MRTAGSTAVTASPLLLIAIAWLLLAPGTHGTFLFDDLANLPALDTVDLTHWREGTLARYIGSNLSGPTGRPVAMLSFLLHDGYWPISAHPFLRTNLLIHCLIGAVLLGFIRRLTLLAGYGGDRRATGLALVTALVWLLHPLQASTVFYTVQRMAQLSALFSLAAMYCYLSGRQHLDQGNGAAGWARIALTPLLAVIGAYSKENAVLVPVALLLVEYWFFDTGERPRTAIRYLRLVMLWLPTALLAVYLLTKIGGPGYSHREFTGVQRLLTEPRILFDYLRLLLLPTQISRGLFHDTYPISTDPWTPVTTLPALIGCIALIGGAIAARRRLPLASWGVLFFFAMHLVESTTIPLELYYEHRNYLPSMGIAVMLAAGGFALLSYRRYLGVLALTAMLGSVAVIGHLRAQNWGRPLRQAEIWTRLNPESPRAWQNLALRDHEHGLSNGVDYALEQWRELRPDYVLPSLSILGYECPNRPLPEERWHKLKDLARTGTVSHGILRTARRLVEQSLGDTCRGLRPDQVHTLIRTLIDNPGVDRPFLEQRLWSLDGQLLLAPGFIADAMDAFRHSNHALFDPPMLKMQARFLASRGYYDEALTLLSEARDADRPAVYGPLHAYWLVYDENSIDSLATHIRQQRHEKSVRADNDRGALPF